MLCVDLEATCDELTKSEAPRTLIVSAAEMETIEIGLAVVNLQTLETIDTFQRYVRPVLHPTLTAFCTGLTSIKQTEVDTAQTFSEVALDVSKFLQKYPNAVWGSWGHYDADQLRADALRARCTPILSRVMHVDLEQHYREIFACPSMGLRPAIKALGLTWRGQYHRGIDDARNLASLVTCLLKKARRTS
jgi:inhibitor of KinA sporulation pathway (predicted exonuclease)